MRDGRLNYAIVGAGRIAHSYVQAFETCSTAGLVVIADVRRDAANSLAEFAKCCAYDSVDAMIEANNLDAVVVCTPPVSHAGIAEKLLSHGLHVICEKPLSIDASSAREMVASAEAKGLKLTMASKFRCVDDVIRAKSLITSGVLGEVILFENIFTAHVDMTGRWNSDPTVSGGGVLMDNGAHSVDLMRYFLGPLAEVTVVEGNRTQKLSVEETVHMFVRSQEGVLGSIDLSWSIHKPLDSYINIYGKQGSLSVGWKQSVYTVAGREPVVFGNGYDKVKAFTRQIDNFSRAIQGEEALIITGKDGIASVEVLEAAYTSLRAHHWTPVSTNGNGYAESLNDQSFTATATHR